MQFLNQKRVNELHRNSRQGPFLLAATTTTQASSSFSTSSFKGKSKPSVSSSFNETPLARQGSFLLEGLDVYSVPASGDGHPLAVYGIQSLEPKQFTRDIVDTMGHDHEEERQKLRPILLLHGRTWSSVPVYHLHLQYGGDDNDEKESSASAKEQSRSLMEALLEKGLQPYAMDFRGFGGTPSDETGFVEPNRCVEDTETVLRWIADRHGMISATDCHKNASSELLPALLGWSQGALIAQLVAQKTNPFLSKLVLYGSIYDPLVRYAREPLYARTESKPNITHVENTFDMAIEDFTIEGTIPPEPARKFAEASLISDPIKAQWRHTYQFNNCDPARIHVPTLVIAGDQDPYAPLHVQQELFTNLGRGSDRTWSILSNCDHAAHLLEGRSRLINIVVSFAQNGKRAEQRH